METLPSNKRVGDYINEILNDINQSRTNWDAQMLAEKRIELVSWLGNLTEKIAEFEHQYYTVISLAMEDPKMTHAKAQSKARAGDEYLRLRKAQGLEKAVIEMIRSINRYIKIKEDEMANN